MKEIFTHLKPWLIIFLILIIGIISELVVYNDFYILVVPDLRDIVKNLFGVQATVAVLSISIQALLGSFVDKTYWGISFSDFYGNKKNPTFTNLISIIVVLVLLLLGLIFLLVKCYNIVIITFIATLFIIVYTTRNIYTVFKGEEEIKKDIQEWYNKQFSKKTCLKTKNETFKNFCNGWKSQIALQTDASFEEYRTAFQKWFWLLIKEQDTITIKNMCQIIQELFRCSLSCSNEKINKQTIMLINQIYYGMACQDTSQYNNTEFLKSFSLLSDIIQEYLKALKEISSEWLEENFDWYNFIGFVDTVTFRFNLDAKYDELISCHRIAIQMGIL